MSVDSYRCILNSMLYCSRAHEHTVGNFVHILSTSTNTFKITMPHLSTVLFHFVNLSLIPARMIYKYAAYIKIQSTVMLCLF